MAQAIPKKKQSKSTGPVSNPNSLNRYHCRPLSRPAVVRLCLPLPPVVCRAQPLPSSSARRGLPLPGSSRGGSRQHMPWAVASAGSTRRAPLPGSSRGGSQQHASSSACQPAIPRDAPSFACQPAGHRTASLRPPESNLTADAPTAPPDSAPLDTPVDTR
jgi:hypothetical protein